MKVYGKQTYNSIMNVFSASSVGIDIGIIVGTGIIFQVTKFVCRNKLFPLIATKYLNLENERLIFHFSKQFWGFSWHTSITVFELYVLVLSDFWSSVINPYDKNAGMILYTYDYPNGSLDIPLGIRILYLLLIGYYFVELFYISFIDRPNDIYVMATHHISALLLLLMSYMPFNGWKIGCAVLFVHELGDVTIYASKTLHYAQIKTASEYLFGFNILVWIWSRLIWFPRLISHSFTDDFLNRWQTFPCVILLSLLLIFHIYWTSLMLKVMYKALFFNAELADARDRTTTAAEEEVDNSIVINEELPKARNSIEMNAIIVENGDTPISRKSLNKMMHISRNESAADIDGDNDNPPLIRRRSSLVEMFVAEKEHQIIR